MPFTIEQLEQKFEQSFKYDDSKPEVLLQGIIDRVDTANGFTRIVDYKTGKDELNSKKRFDDIDYERFEDYNDNTMPFKSLDELMKYEQQQVALLTEDDEWFLFQCIDKINKQQLLLGSATDHIIGFSADGFMFLYDRLVIFNER